MSETHDYSNPGWGHNVEIIHCENGGLKLRAALWSKKTPAEGDYLILKNGRSTCRYQVDKAEQCFDPPDMHFVDLKFAPRKP